ncbi:MarR family transcriptional regulator [Caldivirga maquilingensis]|uniref:ArnR1-like winged helix-turn-helix domain-containing protein n=1 Tax=Caldivirga maquilingensis (strain ATCC 700844 / DSM 13496 / JCM 10307 / IC-167) TaxID=397948 RepID=A8MAA5_CALMQ|nr:MarR family transcriptional regulator [Caldivirga maquilingensis]ABW01037.1 hypothetical protein Cmaq_0188 [Caldivirga maquilingensis IC-167]
MGVAGPEERILLALFMQSAVSEGKAISVSALAKIINSEVSLVSNVLKSLVDQGYVALKDNNVFLTNKGLMRVLSRFS